MNIFQKKHNTIIEGVFMMVIAKPMGTKELHQGTAIWSI